MDDQNCIHLTLKLFVLELFFFINIGVLPNTHGINIFSAQYFYLYIWDREDFIDLNVQSILFLFSIDINFEQNAEKNRYDTWMIRRL